MADAKATVEGERVEKVRDDAEDRGDRDRRSSERGEVLISKDDRRSQRSPERSDRDRDGYRRRSPDRDYRRRSPDRDSYRRRSPERDRPRNSYDRYPSSSRYDRNPSSSRYRERSRSRDRHRDDRRRRSRSRSEDRRESRPATGSSVVDLLHKVLAGGLAAGGLAALQVCVEAQRGVAL